MLTIKELTVQYENLVAIDNANLALEKGEIHGLVGPNGAGKSTLLNICTGLISDYEGSVIYGDKEISKNRHWVKENVGFAPEDTNLTPYLTVREFLKLIQTVKYQSAEEKELDQFIQMLGLSSKMDDLVLELSHGMRQKLLLASAFLGNPEYLIIDEALNGLDPISLHNVRAYLQELAQKKVMVLISSHVLPLIREWCSSIHLMHEGKIIKKFTQSELQEIESKQNQTFSDIFLSLVKNKKNE